MAAAKVPFRREHTGSFSNEQIQRLAQQLLGKVNNETLLRFLAFVTGENVRGSVRGVAITNVDTVVTHNLGRAPRGYLCTRTQGNAEVWCESLPANQPNNTAIEYAFITAGATVTLDLFFF